MNIKDLIIRLFNRMGYHILKRHSYEEIKHQSNYHLLFQYASRFDTIEYKKLIDCSHLMTSQAAQDVVALMLHDFKRSGFFVEFGAVDGKFLSNTYLLEKHFGWNGIVSEPAKIYHKDLIINRSCVVDTRCVTRSSGNLLDFEECTNGILSTLREYREGDAHKRTRRRKSLYKVVSVSLNDLLKENNAPREIDFLSIDTEGSEYEILKSFFPSNYDIAVFVVEHNFTKNRELIHRLMNENNYKRLFEDISYVDDWYVKSEIFNRVNKNG